jgi:hypothetical protein
MIPAIGNMKPLGTSGVDLLTGLQAYWKFEESSGTLYDSHESKDFTPAGGTFTYGNNGINNNCLTIPNLDPYAYTSSGLGTSVGSLSISLWVYFGGHEMSLFSIGRYNQNNHVAIKTDAANSVLIAYTITKPSWSNVIDECTCTGYSGAWHNVILIRDITNEKQELYIDGGLIDSLTSLNNSGNISVSDNFYLFDFACNYSGWSRFYGKSAGGEKLDEIAIYNTVLSSDQITALANRTFYDNF